MRAIDISDEVWNAIAERGRFGETEDDVLRRVFDLPAAPSLSNTAKGRRLERFTSGMAIERRLASIRQDSIRNHFATRKMSSYVQGDKLIIGFAGGERREFSLPARSDKNEIRTARDLAVSFALENGASYGQVNAVKKALTEAGYHLTK